jgi:8-hydroxy-5-deazaflavin:NADPH oxidoreductase
MKVAIIGLGSIGSRLAANLVAGGQGGIISERNLANAEALAARLGAKAQAMLIDDAVEAADIVILATWFAAIKDFAMAHRSALSGKIVVDPSNPIAADGKGGFKIPADQSSGVIITGLLPEGTELVKAFGTLGVGSLSSGANRPEPSRALLRDRLSRSRPHGGQAHLSPAALRRSVSVESINPSTSRSAAIFSNSVSLAGR